MSTGHLSQRVQELLVRGVRMPHPESVQVDPGIQPARIAADVTLHPGCRLSGEQTSIGPGCVIGAEMPATIEDCQLGARVELKGGYFAGAVFLDGSGMGSGAHVRPGTVLEEESSGAHTVGLKQTILFPYVTAGSLINFCDVLMGGGTSRKHHSEIGSSYIHFNFTPHQDKATASLLGDVPRGVLLDQPPIFLGGQGGLVGPVRIGFGCVIPAGVVNRQDAPGDGLILYPPVEPARAPRPYRSGVYRDAARILRRNLDYIGQVRALREWYRHVRVLFMTGVYHRFCWEGALRQLDAVEQERRKRLQEFVGKLAGSAAQLRQDGSDAAHRQAVEQEQIVQAWPRIEAALQQAGDGARERATFLREATPLAAGRDYLSFAPGLPKAAKALATAWLQAVVDSTAGAWQVDVARRA
jgi:hypothetical protein